MPTTPEATTVAELADTVSAFVRGHKAAILAESRRHLARLMESGAPDAELACKAALGGIIFGAKRPADTESLHTLWAAARDAMQDIVALLRDSGC